MSATEMEKRVFAAIDWRIERWFKLKSEAHFDTLDLARAAIRTMRTPTTEMLRDAGMGATCSTEDIAFMWETMIDAASPPEEDKP